MVRLTPSREHALRESDVRRPVHVALKEYVPGLGLPEGSGHPALGWLCCCLPLRIPVMNQPFPNREENSIRSRSGQLVVAVWGHSPARADTTGKRHTRTCHVPGGQGSGVIHLPGGDRASRRETSLGAPRGTEFVHIECTRVMYLRATRSPEPNSPRSARERSVAYPNNEL